MLILYKETEILPATVTQEMRCIVVADVGAPKGSFRNVQLLVPESPIVYAGIYPDKRFVDGTSGKPLTNLAEAAGYNRTYKFAIIPPGAYIGIKLLPNQALWAASEVNLAECSLIIEYCISTHFLNSNTPNETP